MSFQKKKFLSYYKPYKRAFLMVLVSAFIMSLLSLSFPLLVRYLTTEVLEQDLSTALNEVYLIGGIMLSLVAIQHICNTVVDVKGHTIGARMESDMRLELFKHIQTLSPSYFDKQTTGQLMTRITNDLLLVSEFYHHGPEDYLKYGVRFIGSFVILLIIHPVLTVVIFCFFPFLIAFTLYFNKAMNRTLRLNKERIGDINAQVEDSLSGVRIVQSFANERAEAEKFTRENSRFFESRKQFYRAESRFFNGVEAFAQLIMITVVVFGAASIAAESLTLADLLAFMLYIGFLIEPIQKLPHMSTQFQEGVTGFQRFMEILDTEPEIKSGHNAKELDVVRGEVEFRDVTFRYAEQRTDLFCHESLLIDPGEYVALVGPSGVGKSTLCSLIPRFYEVNGGAVLLDGNDVRDVTLDSLRTHVGFVQQDVYLFAGTVLENIRYGKLDASVEEVIKAAKRAHADEFIRELPNGYDSEIGQRGVRLSGGQKQRLSIAQVFLKDPSVLIFDEATSALDNESERVVQDSLEELSRDRTTIVIAHRLSTIRNASRIVVLTGDGIAEQGTHEQLLLKQGVYAKLYQHSFR